MDTEIDKLSNSPWRAIGDPSQIGRVERISSASVSKSRHRHRGHRERRASRREHRRKMMLGITMLIFVLALLAVLVISSMWLSKRQKINAIALAEKPEHARIVERIESKFKSPTEDEALAIVYSSVAASDEASVKKNFRLGSTDVATARKYLTEQHAKRGKPSGASWIGSIDVNDMLIERVLLKWKNGDDIDSRNVFLTPNERGVWQVDFDSFAGKCMPEWDLFVSGEAAEGTVRIWFSSDNYYNGPFVDENKWVCYLMARPRSHQILTGYCKVGSPQAAAMSSIMQRLRMKGKSNRSSFPATLEISRPEGAEQRQYEIKRVLAEGWVLSDKAYDGGSLR